MRTRALLVAAVATAPLLAGLMAAPASAVCYYDLEGVQHCDAPCWPLEGYVADPVGFHCVH